MATKFRETEEFKRGHTGELVVSRWLQDQGYYILPSYDYSGEEEHAPRLEGATDTHVIPDLDASRAGWRGWVEVKTKAQATETRIRGNRLEHGIAKRHWESYHRVQAITGTPVFLAIIEEDTGSLLLASIDNLRGDVRESRMRKGDKQEEFMVYFPRAGFKEYKGVAAALAAMN